MLKRSSDVVPVVRRMMEDEVHYSRMRAATVSLAIPNSTRYIVEEIAALIPKSETLLSAKSSQRKTLRPSAYLCVLCV
jgi:hypothetical protein